MRTLVDLQQIGFIVGRKTLDNILAFRVGREYVCWKRILAIFLMLDFQKAYDRLAHVFIWETLHAMGFSELFVGLVQGLMREGSSKIHVNSSFSREVSLMRGVRQGCPLFPLLFALSTQPLMSILKLLVEEGRLKGIPLDSMGHDQLLYQLFVDDTGLFLQATKENFRVALEGIAQYEHISRAKLNLENTTIVPLMASPFPEWLNNIGCKCVQEGAIATYLDILVGINIMPSQEAEFLLDKVRKQTRCWANRLLSLQVRIILLRHVLRAIHVYHLMALHLDKEGF